MATAATWHDVEHGSYEADLPLWRQLAAATGGPVLDLGAGTGRVSVDLAAQGYDVVALDTESELLAELSEREPSVTTVHADARAFSIDAQFPLIVAPMSLVQILGGHHGRVAMLRNVHAHLCPGRPLRRRAFRSQRRRSGGDSSLRRFPTSSSATAGCSRASP